MSAGEGHLHPAPHFRATMSCSNNQAAAGNSFFVDSLIHVRADAAPYYQSSSLYLAPPGGSEYSYGQFSSGGSWKRSSEPTTQSAAPSSSALYAQGMDTWLEASRSCRVDQHLAQCSFSPSIKEESACCLYEAEKCPKGATVDDMSYSSGGGGTVPVPGYFRLSQTYNASSRLYHDIQPDMTHLNVKPAALPERHPSLTPQQARSQEPERTENHEEPAPAAALRCAPAREEDSSLLSSERSSSSPEPADTRSSECPDKSVKGEEKKRLSVFIIVSPSCASPGEPGLHAHD